MFSDFLFLLFPDYCAACNHALIKNEQHLCTACLFHLPKYVGEPLDKIFWGRVNIEAVDSYLNFVQKGKAQKIIHQIKYKGRKKLGEHIGQLYGHKLKQHPIINTVDLILPVPLHARKKRQRGYNQCDFIAAGLSREMRKNWSPKILQRSSYQKSQTAKSRYERWENIAASFQVKYPKKLMGKHILLIDDVITTGATLEACAQTILKIPGTKVSIATIAYTAR